MAMGNKLVTHQAAVGQCPHPGWHMALTAWPLALGHRLGSSCSAGGALGCRFSQLVIAEESVHSSTCQLHCCVLVLTLKSSTFCIKVLFLGSGNEEQFPYFKENPTKTEMPMVPVILGRVCTMCQIWGLPDATDDQSCSISFFCLQYFNPDLLELRAFPTGVYGEHVHMCTTAGLFFTTHDILTFHINPFEKTVPGAVPQL